MVFFLIVLSFFENKSNWFLMPFYPLVALIIGYSIDDVMQNKFKNRKFILLSYAGIIIIVFFHLIHYKTQYIVPNVGGDEAKIALVAREATSKDDIIYITDHRFPTTVYYSERKVLAVFSDHKQNAAWWVRAKSEWPNILENKNVYIITTKNDISMLDEYELEILANEGEKILLKKL